MFEDIKVTQSAITEGLVSILNFDTGFHIVHFIPSRDTISSFLPAQVVQETHYYELLED